MVEVERAVGVGGAAIPVDVLAERKALGVLRQDAPIAAGKGRQ